MPTQAVQGGQFQPIKVAQGQSGTNYQVSSRHFRDSGKVGIPAGS